MSLPQRHDIRDCVSEESEKNRHWSTTVGLASGAERSDITRDESLLTHLTFLEDYTVEHSTYGIRIEVIEPTGIF